MPDVDPPPLPRRYLLPAFAAVAFALIFPYPSRLNTYVVGDQGDAFFTVWALRSWVQAFKSKQSFEDVTHDTFARFGLSRSAAAIRTRTARRAR